MWSMRSGTYICVGFRSRTAVDLIPGQIGIMTAVDKVIRNRIVENHRSGRCRSIAVLRAHVMQELVTMRGLCKLFQLMGRQRSLAGGDAVEIAERGWRESSGGQWLYGSRHCTETVGILSFIVGERNQVMVELSTSEGRDGVCRIGSWQDQCCRAMSTESLLRNGNLRPSPMSLLSLPQHFAKDRSLGDCRLAIA